MKSQMINARVNVTTVSALEPGQTLRDPAIKGFGARRRKGAPSYFLQTRVKGRLRWLTIGPHGAPWTPESARKEALRLLTEIHDGSDPGQDKRSRREAPTLKQAAVEFLAEHGPKLKATTRREYVRSFERIIVPRLGKRKIADINRADISRLHGDLAETPRLANLVIAMVSKLMTWTEDAGLRPQHSNPCRLIKRYPERRRHRYLSNAEIERLAACLSTMEREGNEDVHVIAAIRLLLMTGARLSEVLTLQWSFVDLQRGLLTLPDSKTGQKIIFLSHGAIAVLKQLRRDPTNPYVIKGARAGSRLVNLQKPWTRIRRQIGLDDVRLHDLRHSFASLAAAQGASLPLIGALLA